MPSSPENSFIPKKRTTTRKRSQPSQRIFLVTIIAYSLLFAALLAAGGTYLYKNVIVTQFEQEVILLDAEINTFSLQDFKRVQEFDQLLREANLRVSNTVSTASILTELDRVVAQPIRIQDLTIERNGDSEMLLSINFTTQTLDAALFQRQILNEETELFSDITINEVDLQSAADISAESADGVIAPSVVFTAEFTVPVPLAVFDPAEARRTDIGTTQTTRSAEIIPINSVSTFNPTPEQAVFEPETEPNQLVQPDDAIEDDFLDDELLDEFNETAL